MIVLHSKIIVIPTINVISVLMIPIVVTILSVTIIYVLMYVQPINNALTSNWVHIVIKDHVEMYNVTHLMIAQDLDYHNPTVKINFVLIVKTLIVQLFVNQMIVLHSKIIVITIYVTNV